MILGLIQQLIQNGHFIFTLNQKFTKFELYLLFLDPLFKANNSGKLTTILGFGEVHYIGYIFFETINVALLAALRKRAIGPFKSLNIGGLIELMNSIGYTIPEVRICLVYLFLHLNSRKHILNSNPNGPNREFSKNRF